MGWFDNDTPEAKSQKIVNVNNHHNAKWTFELLGGAAAYEAIQAYEDHEAREGKIEDRVKAKEFIATAISAYIAREVESKGIDYVDLNKAKYHAQRRCDIRLSHRGRFKP
ncbi:hypothetical protein N7495_007939 [Penicillium taxi]|uniref:uncharacterized protein n=1 Tax=Penicillium taxi TaxID=168475 RepID=UPI0025455A75|nr:uncharacterized protein N7495_007939 [Penicillium taxi]KAJ5887898.1 hypothetical protein N7495_007939 [Penicillium taxi]